MNWRPHIVFIFSDQQHGDAVGFRDTSFRTPNLDRLASQSVTFGNAFCSTPQCSPSRSSLLTGLYPSKTGVMGNVGMAGGKPLRAPTIGALLQRAGYHTAYFGKWHLGKDPTGTAGWDEDLGVTGPETRDDAEVTRRALDFLRRHGTGERPFALFLSYNNPHDICRFGRETQRTPKGPMTLPESWYRKDLSTVPAVQQQFMAEDKGKGLCDAEPPVWRRYREFYREKVHLYDGEVGRVLDALDERGLFENTLVVATSDHGDMDGHQHLVRKGPFMYEQLVRVPLIIRLPDAIAQGRGPDRSDALTVNVDLPATLLDFAEASPAASDGVSLKPLLTGEGPAQRRDAVIAQYYSKQQWVNPIRMIRTRRHKYTLYRVHGEELYDLENDPLELHNVADDPRYAETKARLARALEKWMKENGDPFHTLNPTTRTGGPLTNRGDTR